MKNFNGFLREVNKIMFKKTTIKTNVKLLVILSMILTILLMILSGCSSKTTTQDLLETSSKAVTSIDVSELIGKPIKIAIEKFGEYDDSYDNLGNPICRFSDGLVMTNANDLISSITVDYSKISSKTKYNYKGINGNSTKSDVIKILGEPPKLRFTTDSYSRYPIDDNEFSVTYSGDELVERFTFEMDT